jgi:hypothetical protein
MVVRDNPALRNEEFRFFDTEDLIPNEKMLRPARSHHFTIGLIKNGDHSAKVNLIDYQLHKNSLLVIPPFTVDEFCKSKKDLSIKVASFRLIIC